MGPLLGGAICSQLGAERGVMYSRRMKHKSARGGDRGGVAALDYVLVLGVILPAMAFIMWAGPRIIRLVNEMTCVLVSWPFM